MTTEPGTLHGWRYFGLPAILFFGIFFLLNPHLLEAFSSHYFFGGVDGYQNIWNLWWVDRAVRELGTQPWFTPLLIPAAASSGVLAGAVVFQRYRDPMIGTHSPRLLSMDLLSPFVPGFYWRFRDAVRPLWLPLSPRLPGCRPVR